MKTQINKLRSGTKNQILNHSIDYSTLKKSSSHKGHAGSNCYQVGLIWSKVIEENPKNIEVNINGLHINLVAHWSVSGKSSDYFVSGKSVNYFANISKTDLKKYFNLEISKNNDPFISIECANLIIVSNGKNNYTHICPSLVQIL